LKVEYGICPTCGNRIELEFYGTVAGQKKFSEYWKAVCPRCIVEHKGIIYPTNVWKEIVVWEDKNARKNRRIYVNSAVRTSNGNWFRR
jgi:hypothetical protein